MNKERKNQNLKKNLIFAAAVLLLAAVIGGYYLIQRANRPDKVAHLVYGTFDRAQTDIDLREDADYSWRTPTTASSPTATRSICRSGTGPSPLWTAPAPTTSASSSAS